MRLKFEVKQIRYVISQLEKCLKFEEYYLKIKIVPLALLYNISSNFAFLCFHIFIATTIATKTLSLASLIIKKIITSSNLDYYFLNIYFLKVNNNNTRWCLIFINFSNFFCYCY